MNIKTFDMTNFSNEIKLIRKKLSLSQKDVSHKTGINIDTLRRIENGSVIPRFETLCLLSEVYHIDTITLLNRYSIDLDFAHLFKHIDHCLLSLKLTDLDELVKSLKSYITSLQKYDSHLHQSLESAHFLVDSLYLYHTKSTSTKIQVERIHTYFVRQYSNFSYDDLSSLPFNTFELRLLLILGILISESDLTLSNTIFEFILILLDSLTNRIDSISSLQLKTLYNLSYNHYLLKNDVLSHHYASQGIEICHANNSTELLAHLYARLSISQYHLHIPLYKKTASYSLSLLDMQSETRLYKEFLAVFNEKYQMNLTSVY